MEDLMMSHANNSLIKLPDLPSHSQSVKRSVKIVTEALHSYYGFDNRQKTIMAKITSRKMLVILCYKMLVNIAKITSNTDTVCVFFRH